MTPFAVLLGLNTLAIAYLLFRSIHMAGSVADLDTSITALEAAFAALKPVAPVDLSAEVARVDAVTAALVALETPVAAPAPAA